MYFGRAVVRAQRGDHAGAAADLAEARRRESTVDAAAAAIQLTPPAVE
jgi:hypothetical protein